MSDITIGVVDEFARLFRGRLDAYGTGAGGVIHEPPTNDLLRAHLLGEGLGIGIFPLRDDGTVWFGAVDLDEPNFELAAAMQRLIPGRSFIERSRSGNAHIWVFFDGPAPAWAVRTVLRNATEALGRTDVEIFPKQDEVRPGGVGNYINLPYHGLQRPILATVPGDPEPSFDRQGLRWFLELAASHRQSPDAWVTRARTLGGRPPAEREASSEWGTAPVLHDCAAHIVANRASNPVRPGHRHEVLFHLACMLNNYEGFDRDEAKHYVDLTNQASPRPLGQNEVDRLFENAYEGQYTFTGCDQPVMQPYVLPDCPIAQGKAGR